jgi:hypothetical protein
LTNETCQLLRKDSAPYIRHTDWCVEKRVSHPLMSGNGRKYEQRQSFQFF